MSVVDRLVIRRRLRLAIQCLEHLILHPWPRFRARLLRGTLSRRGAYLAVARQVEAREVADHGVAGHPDVAGNLAAGQTGLKAVFQELEAFGGPGGCVGGHGDGPKLRVVTRLLLASQLVRTATRRGVPLWRLAVVADRKQPVLDGEPNAFLDQ